MAGDDPHALGPAPQRVGQITGQAANAPYWPATSATNASTTPSTPGRSARSHAAREPAPTTTHAALPTTYTTKPYAHWESVSSGSSTAAYATHPLRRTHSMVAPPKHRHHRRRLTTYAPGMSNPPPDFPLSYSNIHPESPITTFQYGTSPTSRASGKSQAAHRNHG
jgi:hypothetical protein